jgi:hypothetical protein
MKKQLIIAVVLVMLLGIFAGCSGTGTPTYKTGLGQVVSIGSSKDVSVKDGADVAGLAQVDTIMAAVTVDANGKIVKLTIDSAQTKVNFDKTGKITTDKAAAQKTKVELGAAYGMAKASPIKAEWYTQIAELEKWMIGKTIEEVKSMKTTDKDGKKIPNEADLVSKVTIGVADYIAAVEEAVKNAK